MSGVWNDRLADLRMRVPPKDYALLIEAGDALDAVLAQHPEGRNITLDGRYDDMPWCQTCNEGWPCKTVTACTDVAP